MAVFKRLEVVVVDNAGPRYAIERLREEYRRGELVQVADLADVDGKSRDGIDVERLTKVAG